MARQRTLHDDTGNVLYPNTLADCVYKSDGTSISEQIGDIDISHIGDGTITGAINEVNRKTNTHNTFSNVKVGDVSIESSNRSDTLELASGTNVTITPDADNNKVTISSQNTWRGIQNNLTSTSTTDSLSANQGKVLKDLLDSHEHNYAGSSSAGGSATSAVKLDTATAGSATQPVYFKDGKPVATTYIIEKSVPSNAVFTDTTYSTGTASASGLTKLYTGTGNATDGTITQSAITKALNAKAASASPTLTGTPKAPTAAAGTNTTQIATTAFVQSVKTSHDSSTTAHSDIRTLIDDLTTRLNVLADSDDTTLDQLSEIVTYIKSNKTLIESVTTNKVSVSDVIDNLTSTDASKPLSANQGKVLKGLIDTLTNTVNTKIDGITGDNSHITATTSGTTTTISHNAVTRNNTTSNETPSIGGSFSAISSVTSDNKGHITAVNTKTIKLPAYSTGTASTSGITKLYTGTGSNTDGTITQSVLTNLLNGKASSSHTHTASQINMANGQNAETCLGSIQGITDSRTSTSSNIAFSAAGGNNLQGQINTLNSNLNSISISSSQYKLINDCNNIDDQHNRVYIDVINYDALNSPINMYGILLQVRVNDITDENYIEQFAFMKNGIIYHRSKINGTWNDWSHNSNDGSTSTINPVSDVNNFYSGIGLFSSSTANIPTAD